MLVFVIERIEETRANKGRQTAGPTGKVYKNLRPGGGKIRKQLSIAKAEIERLKENRKITRKRKEK